MDQFFFPAYVASPAMMATPLFSTPGYPAPAYTAPTVSNVIPTPYTPYQNVSSLPAVPDLAALKPQQSRLEVLARTVHLRCLPPFMKQKDLADVFDQCGEYLRVRICGNAATHQKWVYGFVEFATTTAAAAMLTHSGLELSNGADKPALRLKCSPSKQPILDCMANDADVVAGTPCGFGRGCLAECTLNDALLVVGSNGSAGVSATADTSGALTPAAPTTRTSPFLGNSGTPALTSPEVRPQAICGVLKTRSEPASIAAAASTFSMAGESTSISAPHGKATEVLSPAPVKVPAMPLEALKSTSFAQLVSVNRIGNPSEIDVMQQLAEAFQGLCATATTTEGQLDGPAIVRRAETMTLDALTRASHLSSDTRIQDILCDLAQLLSFLDANAAVTGGAAQTASGDCTATLPQRVTQLRMLANLVGALLCLLRRSVADAVPYVEAVLVTFAQIPPSSLLLRARQHEKAAPLNRATTTVTMTAASGSPDGAVLPPYAAPTFAKAALARRAHLLSLSRGAFIDEDVTGALLDLIDEGDDGEGAEAKKKTQGSLCTNFRQDEAVWSAPSSTDELQQQQQQQQHSHVPCSWRSPANLSAVSSPSNDSLAYMDTTDVEDLHRHDTYFTGYVLNALVTVGLAMEGVQPALARGAYMLANRRAIEVFGCPSPTLVRCLATSSSVNPRLLEELFDDAGREDRGRDIAFFPRLFFESVKATWERVRDTRGTDGFYRLLPPNYVVPLFQT